MALGDSGVPSAQPTTTANGRPIATTPKKTNFGDKRTPITSVDSRKSYGFRTLMYGMDAHRLRGAVSAASSPGGITSAGPVPKMNDR
ncbi:hypothetical protein [Actinoplanes teichomyceticus]|uniref:hypothetical protein n=1 Tax=Actinoplanes teichomyceticus TaxID=1867 RepID=UPI00119FE57B|nr:hypothetical protein [Actinoplanes teichomyceticus]